MLSGYQDSNLGPPAPKAGALTGLRYIPNHVEPKPEFVSFRGAKIYTFFYYAKFFAQLFLFFAKYHRLLNFTSLTKGLWSDSTGAFTT